MHPTLNLRCRFAGSGLFFVTAAFNLCAGAYDPLAINSKPAPAHIELSVHGSERNRDIPLRVYLPNSTVPAPVVLFSHGLGGSRAGSVFLGEHWAARGYVAVFLQHPGSDDSVWKGEQPLERMAALRKAASLDNFLLRVQDVHVVLNELENWSIAKGHTLAGRLDLTKVGMSGHSFGAITTEAVSGETLAMAGQKYTDPRIKAAVIFSPSAPELGDPAKAFGSVKIPWLLMTGTKDVAPIGHADMKSRLAVYPVLQGAPKYELVLHNAEH